MYEDVVGQRGGSGRGGGGTRGGGGFARPGGGMRGGGFARPGGFRHRGHAGRFGRFGRFGRASWWGGWGGWWPGWGYGYGYDGWCNPYLAPYDPDCWYGYGPTGIAGDGIGEIELDWAGDFGRLPATPQRFGKVQGFGARVAVTTGEPGLNLRSEPNPFASLITFLPNGTRVLVFQTDIPEKITPPGITPTGLVPGDYFAADSFHSTYPLEWWRVQVAGGGPVGFVRAVGPRGERNLQVERRLVRTRADTRTPEQIAASRASAAIYQRLQEQIALQARDPKPFRAKLIASLQQRYEEARRALEVVAGPGVHLYGKVRGQ